ncbi:MAG: hypothetical protein ACJ0BU_08640 [Candidatus Puniceispirillales bacterium]
MRIILFVFIIILFFLKISYWSSVYASSLENVRLIPSYQCVKILNNGKINSRPADGDGRFYSIFYNNNDYIIEIIYNKNMKSYNCLGGNNTNQIK